MRKNKMTHDQKIAALKPPSQGFLKDTQARRLTPKSLFLQDLEARQIQEVVVILPANVAKFRR
jgi:hypothetical protein